MIRGLHHVALAVPDVATGVRFYETFGLRATTESPDRVILRCEGREQPQVALVRGGRKRLLYVSFSTDKKGLVEIEKRLKLRSVSIHASPPFELLADGLWFQDPVGDWVHVHAAADEPSRLTRAPDFNFGGKVLRIGERGVGREPLRPKPARPRRLAHLIKFTPNLEQSSEFYRDALGMKTSDLAPGKIEFLRFGGGGAHHSLGLASSTHAGLHHLAFEVGDLDELFVGGQTMLRAGYRDGFGPGRHLPGSNYFHYIRDPWNSLVEYSWDMDEITNDTAWTPLSFTDGDHWIATWSTYPPPDDFIVNMEEP